MATASRGKIAFEKLPGVYRNDSFLLAAEAERKRNEQL
jgi:hypothetical protein